ncbi:MAG: hypothetical protein FJ340_07840 [Sphingomonadales bacterium]|nr:hypothetical protein [Sphingomonadales bacterium]
MTILSPRLLSIAVILLLVINSGLVIFLLMERNRSHHHSPEAYWEKAFDKIATKLEYTALQKEQHRSLRKQHVQQMRPFYDSIRQTKVMLFSNTGSMEESDSLFAVHMEKLSSWQITLNRLHYEYYKKVRSLLTPTQQPRYDSILRKMMERGRRDSSQYE